MFKYYLAPSKMGKYYVPQETSNCPVCYAMVTGSFYDAVVFNSLVPHIKPNTIVIDAGACYGQMTIGFAKLASHVYSFEMNPESYQLVCMNVGLHECQNVSAINCAVWDVSNTVLNLPVLDTCGVRFPLLRACWHIDNNRTDGFKVNSLKIDTLNLGNVSVMKFDIQGADLRGMWGARETIKRCKPVIAWEYESVSADKFGTPLKAYTDYMEELDYKLLVSPSTDNYVYAPK